MTTADYIRAILRIARCTPERWAGLTTARKGRGLEYASQRVAVPLLPDGAVDVERIRLAAEILLTKSAQEIDAIVDP